MIRSHSTLRLSRALCLGPGLGLALFAVAIPGFAADAWYVGIGGGVSLLEPDTASGVGVSGNQGTAASVFFGRDLDERTGVQLQLHQLGDAELVDGGTVGYFAADASLMYRVLDSRERTRGEAGVALYGRAGIGFLDRDATTSLDADAPVRFGIGAGLEFMLNANLSLRTEALYYDKDAGAAFASVVFRFGGRGGRRPPVRPQPAAAPQPAPQPAPQTTSPPELTPQPDAAPTTGPTTGPGTAPITSPTTGPGTAPISESGSAPVPGLLPTPQAPAPTAPTAPPAQPEQPEQPEQPLVELPPATIPAPDESADRARAPRSGLPVPGTTAPRRAVPGTPPRDATPGRMSTQDTDGDSIGDPLDICPASTPGYPVRENGCALFDGVLSQVRFEDGGNTFLPGAREQLDELARLLERFPKSRISVHAHSDASGSERDQQSVSRARLRAVGLYLVGRGVAANRLVLRAFGATRPLGGAARLDNRIEVFESTL